MFRIDGINGESIVVDGNWVEKLRTNTSRGRNPADKYSGPTSRRPPAARRYSAVRKKCSCR